MSGQYPIWNEINSCRYKGNKSYGVVETGDVRVKVGSSSSNSREFLRTITTKRNSYYKGKPVVVFRYSVDDVVLKVCIFEEDKNGRAGKFIKEWSKLSSIKGLKIEGLGV